MRSLLFSLSGVHGSRWDVPGRRDSRNESDKGPEAAAHAAVAGVETFLNHSHIPPLPPPPPPLQQQQQDPLEPAESQSILFLCIDVVNELYIYIYKNSTFQSLKAVLCKILRVGVFKSLTVLREMTECSWRMKSLIWKLAPDFFSCLFRHSGGLNNSTPPPDKT